LDSSGSTSEALLFPKISRWFYTWAHWKNQNWYEFHLHFSLWTSHTVTDSSQVSNVNQASLKGSGFAAKYHARMWRFSDRNESGNELEIYLRESCEDLFEGQPSDWILSWWRVWLHLRYLKDFYWLQQQVNQSRFPNLAKMARDYLAIPGASVAVERIFSGGRDTLGYSSLPIRTSTFRVLSLLKNFFKLETKRIEEILTNL
jgi:hypothetical protein